MLFKDFLAMISYSGCLVCLVVPRHLGMTSAMFTRMRSGKKMSKGHLGPSLQRFSVSMQYSERR